MRPTKYSDEMLERAQGYVIDPTGHVPTVAGLARFLNVSRETMYEWGRVHPEFSDTLSALMDEQQEKLIQGGLGGDFNATIAKLMLANHGFHDKADNTHSAPDGGPVQVVERTIVKTPDPNG